MAIHFSQNDEGGMDFVDSEGNKYLRVGGPGTASVTDPSYRVQQVAKVPLSDTTTGGGVLSWQNSTGGKIFVTGLVLDVTTAGGDGSTATSVDAGTTSVSATTSSDNLIDGVSVLSTGTFNNTDDAGTNGKALQAMSSGDYLTVSQAGGSGAVTGLDGYAYIRYYIA